MNELFLKIIKGLATIEISGFQLPLHRNDCTGLDYGSINIILTGIETIFLILLF